MIKVYRISNATLTNANRENSYRAMRRELQQISTEKNMTVCVYRLEDNTLFETFYPNGGDAR